ncbi:hypothetical protein SLA2020_264370 [Shorea laevis]
MWAIKQAWPFRKAKAKARIFSKRPCKPTSFFKSRSAPDLELPAFPPTADLVLGLSETLTEDLLTVSPMVGLVLGIPTSTPSGFGPKYSGYVDCAIPLAAVIQITPVV